MDFKDYQLRTADTAIYPKNIGGGNTGYLYPVMGLAGESGENVLGGSGDTR